MPRDQRIRQHSFPRPAQGWGAGSIQSPLSLLRHICFPLNMWGWDVSLIKSPTNKNGDTHTDKRGYHIKRTGQSSRFLTHACVLKFPFPCFCCASPGNPAAFSKQTLKKTVDFCMIGAVPGSPCVSLTGPSREGLS